MIFQFFRGPRLTTSSQSAMGVELRNQWSGEIHWVSTPRRSTSSSSCDHRRRTPALELISDWKGGHSPISGWKLWFSLSNGTDRPAEQVHYSEIPCEGTALYRWIKAGKVIQPVIQPAKLPIVVMQRWLGRGSSCRKLVVLWNACVDSGFGRLPIVNECFLFTASYRREYPYPSIRENEYPSSSILHPSSFRDRHCADPSDGATGLPFQPRVCHTVTHTAS